MKIKETIGVFTIAILISIPLLGVILLPQLGYNVHPQVEYSYQEAIKLHEVNVLKQKNAVYIYLLNELIKEIVTCESGGVHNTWGDIDYRFPAFGIAQYQFRTFEYLKELAGLHFLEWRNESDQLTLLTWAIENGYGKYWTCYRNIVREDETYGRYFG